MWLFAILPLLYELDHALLIHLPRYIKKLQDFLDESAVEDNQKWDDQFHDLKQTLPLLSEGSSPNPLPLDMNSIRPTSSENKTFGMQVASDGDLLDAELPEATPAVQIQIETSPKAQLKSAEVLPKPIVHVKRQTRSYSMDSRRKPRVSTGIYM